MGNHITWRNPTPTEPPRLPNLGCILAVPRGPLPVIYWGYGTLVCGAGRDDREGLR